MAKKTSSASEKYPHERPIGGSYSSWRSSKSEMTGMINSTQMNTANTNSVGEKYLHERPIGGSYSSWRSSNSEMTGIVSSTQMNTVNTNSAGEKYLHERPIGGSYSSWRSSNSEMTGIVNSTQMNTAKTNSAGEKYSHERPIGGSYSSWRSSKPEITGMINSMQMNTAKSSVEEKFHASRGHGFAAERANDLWDGFTGKKATIVGDDNKPNGADRIVNGMDIQSKYCSDGYRCISECFNRDGFRYYVKDSSGKECINPDGTRKPMQIEVPASKNDKIYKEAVEEMQRRIDKGQVEGVKDAREIIRKGNVTYDQAKNIAKAGTVDSLLYDAASGIKIGAYSGSISAAITFAMSTWNGKSFEEALESSVAAGLQTGGVAWASSILVGQMTKAGVNSLLVPYTDAVVGMLGSKATAVLAKSLRGEALWGEGTKKIADATAKNYVSKFLRGNIVTSMATIAVMSTGDVIDIFRERISLEQLFKNVVNTSAAVGGGVGGWSAGEVVGAAIGTFIAGPTGAKVGSFVGGGVVAIAGGILADKASRKIMDGLIEDDAKEMLEILKNESEPVATDFLLNKDEWKQITDALKKKLQDGSKLKDMYASKNRSKFARELIVSCTEPVVKRRPKIYLPSTQDYVRGLRNVLEKVASNEIIS